MSNSAPPTRHEINATASAPRELTEGVLDLVVGGAGDPPPAVMDRWLRDGVVRPMPLSRPTGP